MQWITKSLAALVVTTAASSASAQSTVYLATGTEVCIPTVAVGIGWRRCWVTMPVVPKAMVARGVSCAITADREADGLYAIDLKIARGLLPTIVHHLSPTVMENPRHLRISATHPGGFWIAGNAKPLFEVALTGAATATVPTTLECTHFGDYL